MFILSNYKYKAILATFANNLALLLNNKNNRLKRFILSFLILPILSNFQKCKKPTTGIGRNKKS
nr:MAG TPA: hypothetical protein [Caudoviricetes sp.]